MKALKRSVPIVSPPRSPGFTLVEVVVALALGALLVGIALPAYRGYLDRARGQGVVQDLVMMDMRIQARFLEVGAYPASLDDIGLGHMRDPWGRPYQYLNLQTLRGNGQARKNRSQVPINSDFDLYSMGPDGRSVGPLTAAHSRDDIIRANNGRFLGPVSEY